MSASPASATASEVAPNEYVPLGVFRSRSRDGSKTPPSRWIELINAGEVDGFQEDGRYYVRRDAALPRPQPEPIWLTWARSYYHEIRKSAERRDIAFEISKEALFTLLAEADGRCQVTGIEFCEDNPANAYRRPWMPSLDRIDSSKGYRPDNCRIVCVAVNSAINEFGLDALILIARGLLAKEDKSQQKANMHA